MLNLCHLWNLWFGRREADALRPRPLHRQALVDLVVQAGIVGNLQAPSPRRSGMKGLLVAAVLVAAAFAGCASLSGPATTTSAAPATLLERTAAKVPPLAFDAHAAVDWWSDFAQTYTFRNAFAPNNAAARDHIPAPPLPAGPPSGGPRHPTAPH